MKPGLGLGETPTLGMMRRELHELVRREGQILADIKASLRRIEGGFDGMATGLRGLERDINGLSRNIDRFRRDLPTVIRDAIREVFHEMRRRKR